MHFLTLLVLQSTTAQFKRVCELDTSTLCMMGVEDWLVCTGLLP